MTREAMNPYEVLGARPDADREKLQALYRQLVRAHHPDRACDEVARVAATERMVAINHAWHLLSDPQRRAAYDARAQAGQLEAARRARLVRVRYAPSLRREPPPDADLREQQLRPPRGRATREEKQRTARARARLKRMRREDKKRLPSVRCQLAEAARLFAQENRASEAIEICHEILRVDARNVPARALLGDLYLQMGRADRALPLWEQALILQPENAAIRRKLAALRPHDAKSYSPQPRIPHRGSNFDAANTPRTTATPRYPATPRVGFWGKLMGRIKR